MNTKDAPLFLRCDSTSQIGTGHIMRCIALAQAWQDEGGKVIFISHCESEKLRERILKEGFDLILINYPHPHPSDLEQTLSTINNFSHFSFHHSAPWLVLDGYHFTPEYQKVIRDAGIRLLVIDDMNHLPYYHADIILNQNIYAGDLKYNCDSNTKLLLGTKYVLLRREFLKYRDFKREIPEKAKKILVTMGGADPDNVTSKVIQALNLLNDSELEVKIIIGPSNPHVESIRNELALSSFNFHLLHSVDDDMPALMAWADLAISGAGSTVWELVFMGLPIITIAVAENQKQVAEKLHSIGIAYNLGWHADIFPEQISQSLSNFITNCKLFTDKNTIAKNTIDGDGINRILMRLNLKKIRLRQVTENDCELIWRWANDPDVRNSAFNSDPIPWETHKCCFRKN